MLKPFISLFAVLIYGGLLVTAHADELTVKEPYVRATPPGQKVTGGFLQIENTSDKAVSLVDARSEVAAKVELHETRMEDGMMRMRRVEQIVIPAGGSVALQPGGLHVMFMGLKRGLKPGDSIAIELHFSDGSKQQLNAPVRKVMARMQHGK